MVNTYLHKTQLIAFTLYIVIVTGQTQLYQSSNGLTCQMCPVGTYLVASCTSNKGKPSCQVCPRGTYHSEPNNVTQCKECSFCRITQIETKRCSQNHDSVCTCPAGKYWHSYVANEGICKYHTICNYGEVIVNQGNSTADTVCGQGAKVLQQHHEVGSNKPKNGKRRKGKKRRRKCRKCRLHKKTYNSENNLRCQLCPAGTFLVRPCTVNYGRSICEPCLPDHFNSMPNRASQCGHCTICPLGKSLVKVCSNRTDTICKCPKDKVWINYSPAGDGRCVDYSKCKPNQVVIKNGTAMTENICGDIEEHSTSHDHTNQNKNKLLYKQKRRKGKKRRKCKNIRRRKCKDRRLQKRKRKKDRKQRNKENINSTVK